MSDWQVGDLAVCVVDGAIPCPHMENTLHLGKSCPHDKTARRVQSVAPSVIARGWCAGQACGCIVLEFDDGSSAVSQRCRKIDKHEPCEEEFTALLKRSKRKVSA